VSTLIDNFTRECLALKVAKSLSSHSITEKVNRVIEHRGTPRTIQPDELSDQRAFFDSVTYAPIVVPVFFLDRSVRKDV
jgi:hypothetical protein